MCHGNTAFCFERINSELGDIETVTQTEVYLDAGIWDMETT